MRRNVRGTRFLRAGLATSLLTLAIAAPVTAAAPAMEWVDVTDSGIAHDLTDACGVEVRFDVTGHFVVRLFTDASGNPARELNTYALHVTWTSAYGQLRSVNTGPDRVTYLSDGSIIITTTGNITSLTARGQGRVYSDVGWSTFHLTFDADGNASFDFVDSAGQHWGDFVAAACGVLAP